MDSAKKCHIGQIIYGSCRLLPKIHKRVSNIASPITSLQKKGVKFEWTPKREESFQ
jgi:hypothetical protein